MVIGLVIFLLYICLGIVIYRWSDLDKLAKEVGYDQYDLTCLRVEFVLCWPVKILVSIIVGAYFAFKDEGDKD